MMILPQEFVNRMQDMLQEAYPAFVRSYENSKYQALRVNPLKVDKQAFLANAPFTLRPVAWEANGFYYESDNQPGKHPWHEAGVYYIQEPSAMAPVAYLETQPGEKVLDLCAAPGGKSTQIAAALQGEGLLVCNEIHPQRAKILSENVERMGIRNALVTNETPATLADTFVEFFDKILVDAPCSGEGMFRKNEEACEEWSLDNVQLCADRQDEILDCAAGMLRPGGRLVFSTCTFAPAENEGSISRFVKRHPEFHIVEVPFYEGMSRGCAKWTKEPAEGIEKTIRLWPHLLQGEGHYLAVLQKDGEVPEGYQGFCKGGLQRGIRLVDSNKPKERNKGKGAQKDARQTDLTDYQQFIKDTLRIDLDGELLLFGEQLYLIPDGMPSIQGLKVMRPGLHLGTLKKNRFEPSHALALTLAKEDVVRFLDISSTDSQAKAYLNGMTLNHEGEKGWYLITVDGYSLGWGKLAGQVMKNHYPKGLRK